MDQESMSTQATDGFPPNPLMLDQRAVRNAAARAQILARGVQQALPPVTPQPARRRWAQRVVLVMITLGFATLLYATLQIFQDAPPIPDRVTAPDGTVLFTGDDIREGQQVFLKYGLLDNRSVWTRRPSDPGISSELQNTLALHGATRIAQQRYGVSFEELTPEQRAQIIAEVRLELQRNRYDPKTRVLAVGPNYGDWYKTQPQAWQERLSQPARKGGKTTALRDPGEINQLSAFVAWTEWASHVKDKNPPVQMHAVSAAALVPEEK